MKRVDAYEALDGSLHKDKKEAVAASIVELTRTIDLEGRGHGLCAAEADMLIKHRKKIVDLLTEIDAPEFQS